MEGESRDITEEEEEEAGGWTRSSSWKTSVTRELDTSLCLAEKIFFKTELTDFLFLDFRSNWFQNSDDLICKDILEGHEDIDCIEAYPAEDDVDDDDDDDDDSVEDE